MGTFLVMLRNLWTTALGIIAGAINYLSTSGAVIPATRKDLLNLLFSAALAGLGIVAKSATVGSQPGQPPGR